MPLFVNFNQMESASLPAGFKLPNLANVSFDCVQVVNNPFVWYASDGPLEAGDTNDRDTGGAHPAEYHTWSGPAMSEAPASMVKSAKIAIEAEGNPCGSPKRIEGAKKALKIDSNCTEAYYLLGYEAKTREEALRWFEKGIEAGPAYVGEDEFKAARRAGNTWYRLWMRGFYRCLFGAANVLRRMGRYEEAYTKYKLLLEFDTKIHTYNGIQYSTAINPYPSYVECLLGLGKWDEAAALLFSRDEAMLDLAFKSSSYITWNYTRVLVALKLGKVPELPDHNILQYLLTTYWNGVCAECAGSRTRPPGKAEIAKGHSCEPDPILAMLGGPALPERREAGEVGPISAAAVRSYVREFGKHWRAESGVLQQVLDMDRTVRGRCAGPGRRECPIKVIWEFGCQCCGHKGIPKAGGCKQQTAAPAQTAAQENVPPANIACCAHCGEAGVNLRRCGACRRAQYCDETCQRLDWPTHKVECKAMAAKVQASAAARAAPSDTPAA